ncbi:MAG: porin [Halorhodospira sp.]
MTSLVRAAIAALAVTGALAAAGAASAAVDLSFYGRADVSVDYDHGGRYDAWDLASNASRFGARATHELDTGLQVYGQVERCLDLNRGNDVDWCPRDTFLGLSDAWGTIRLGYMDTVLKDLRSQVDAFGSQMGNARNVLRGAHDPHLDARFPNAVRYTSPEQGGWGVDLQASLDWSRDEEQDEIVPAEDNDRGAFSGAVRYRGERLWVAGGYERVSGLDEPPEARPESSAEGYRLAMAVEVTDAWRVTALGQATHDAYETGAQAYSDAVAYGAGTRYALEDDLDLRAHYYALDVDAPGYGAELFSIGPVYHASEQLQLYATAAYLDNDDRSELVPWRLGRTAGPPGEDPGIGPGRAAWGVSSGVRFDF